MHKPTLLAIAITLLAACTDPDVEARRLAIPPEDAAADLFAHPPATIPAEHVQDTLDLWASLMRGEATCSEGTWENGDQVETCCDAGRCCTNNSTGNSYGCTKIRKRPPISQPW